MTTAPPTPAAPAGQRRSPSTRLGAAWRRATLARDVLLLTALGLVARLVALDHQPLWRDEAFTRLVARRDLGPMLDAVRHDSAPPLSYLLVHLALHLGDTVWLLRLTTVLAGVAAVPLTAALGRRVGGGRAARCAAALAAVSPATVLPSRDARMYALGATFVLAVVLTAWRAAEAPTRSRLALLGAAVAGALLTQYLTALAIAATGIALVLVLRPPRATVLRGVVAVACGALPLLVWLPFAAPQLQHASAPFWVQPTGANGLAGAVTEWLTGPSVDAGIPHRLLLITVQGATLTLLLIATLALTLRLRRAPVSDRRAAAVLAVAGAGGIALLLLISAVHPLFDARYASLLWPPLTVLVGAGVASLRPGMLAPIPLVTASAATVLLVTVPLRADVVPLVALLPSRPPAGTVVMAHREVYLQVLVEENPAQQAVTHVPERSLDWYWGLAAYPAGALQPLPPPGTTEVDEILQSDTGEGQGVPDGFRVVSRSCAVDACLVIWRR